MVGHLFGSGTIDHQHRVKVPISFHQSPLTGDGATDGRIALAVANHRRHTGTPAPDPARGRGTPADQ
jgi:hypothetical protein